MLGWWDGVGWCVAHEILVLAQGPLVLGFWGFGLDNFQKCSTHIILLYLDTSGLKKLCHTIPGVPGVSLVSDPPLCMQPQGMT